MVFTTWQLEDLFPKLLYLHENEYSYEVIGKLAIIAVGEIPYRKYPSYFIKKNVNDLVIKEREGLFQKELRNKFENFCNIHQTYLFLKKEGVNTSNIKEHYDDNINNANNLVIQKNLNELRKEGFEYFWKKNDFSLEGCLEKLVEGDRFFESEKCIEEKKSEGKFALNTIENYLSILLKQKNYNAIGLSFLTGSRAFYNNPERQKNLGVRAYKRFAEYHEIRRRLSEQIKLIEK